MPCEPRGWHRTRSAPPCPGTWRDAAARRLLARGRPGDGALRRRLGRHGWQSAPALPAVPASPRPRRALVGGRARWGPPIGPCAGPPPGVLGVVRGAAASRSGRRRGVPLRARRDRRGPGAGPDGRAGPIARSARPGRRGRRRRRRLGRSGRDRRGGAPARSDVRRLGVERGPAGARNAGLSVACTTIVAFVDSDCVPAPGWLPPLLAYFRDPLTAAAAPRVVGADDMAVGGGNRAGTVMRYARARNPLDRGTRPAAVRPLSPVPFVPSAALLVRRDLTEGSELFDPRLRGGEDVDLVWRVVEAGWDVQYVPESAVMHDGPDRVGPLLGRRAFYGTTAAALWRRHAGAVAPLHVSGWSLAVWALVLRRRPAAASAVLAGSIGLLARRLTGLVRDPVAVATRIAGGGTVRSALPALGEAVRAWSPFLVLGLLHRRTRRASALALLAPASAGLGGGLRWRRPGPLHRPPRRRRPVLRRGRMAGMCP